MNTPESQTSRKWPRKTKGSKNQPTQMEHSIGHGDILLTSCINVRYPCWHRAIVLWEQEAGEPCGSFWIYHNTPGKKNEFGGNISRQPLETFLKSRRVRKVEKAGLDADYVRAYSWANRHEPWHAIRYNCEDYVNEIATGSRESGLRDRYIAACLGTLALYFSAL